MTDHKSQRLEQLGAEARYHRQRLDLYRARLYGGRALSWRGSKSSSAPPTALPPVSARPEKRPRLPAPEAERDPPAGHRFARTGEICQHP